MYNAGISNVFTVYSVSVSRVSSWATLTSPVVSSTLKNMCASSVPNGITAYDTVLNGTCNRIVIVKGTEFQDCIWCSDNNYFPWCRSTYWTTSSSPSPRRIQHVHCTRLSTQAAWAIQIQFFPTRYPSLLGRQLHHGMRKCARHFYTRRFAVFSTWRYAPMANNVSVQGHFVAEIYNVLLDRFRCSGILFKFITILPNVQTNYTVYHRIQPRSRIKPRSNYPSTLIDSTD